jgi:CheY-like chemotaxis protein
MNPSRSQQRVELLLIDDNPSDVRLVREALAGYAQPTHLSAAADGSEALDWLRRPGPDRLKPHLILLDLNLPRTNGREILTEIKTDPVLRRIPVIVFTSSQADNEVALCYNLYANCYVVKPFDWTRFETVIQAILTFWLSIATLLPAGADTGVPA